MIRQFELVEMVRAYNPAVDDALLNRAYVFGVKAHGGQTRASGEPYFNHPVEVAAILTELRLDDATIVTALLHDTLEDTDATFEEIKEKFGQEIAQLVDGVTKLSRLALVSRERAQAESFRKLLMAMARDARVLLVKMADRLHNMRTIGHLNQERKERIARETIEIFAPLAGRMGMQRFREELEDLAFAVISPDARLSIMRRFVHLKKSTGAGVTDEIEALLRKNLAEAGVTASVAGREKRPYAIWRKMQSKGVSFEQLSDIVGFRINVGSEADCYRALGVIHQAFRAVPGRFKDYISGPKANGYRSLHSAVIGPGGARIEVQIRTHQMHEVAETGVAAHWSYKNGARAENPFAVDPFRWLRDLVERVERGAPAEEDPEDVLEDAKRELTFDQVFCFTPRGDVIGLPLGATALDFAYAIHTDVGHSAVGVKINGKRAPLWQVLRNGQTVEVLQSDGQRPSPVWRQIAKTGRAQAAIRRTLREQERRDAAALGEKITRRAFERVGRDLAPTVVETARRLLGESDAESMFAKVGAAKLTATQVLDAVYPAAGTGAPTSAVSESGPKATLSDPSKPFVVVAKPSRWHSDPATPSPTDALEIPAATCCRPLPGERVIALREPTVGFRLHAIDCPTLAAYEDAMERWLDVAWSPLAHERAMHASALEMIIANEPGALGDVCSLIGAAGANIDGVEVLERKLDFFRLRLDLEVRDLRHLSAIITALSAQSFVAEATRLREAAPSDRGHVAEKVVAEAQTGADDAERGGAAAASRPDPAATPDEATGADAAETPFDAKTAAP